MSKHGVYGFTKYVMDNNYIRATFYNSTDVKVPRLSEILALLDYRTLVVGFPFSYPVRGWYLKNTVLVYDAFSPKPFIYPSKCYNYIRFFRYIDYNQVRPSELAEKVLKRMIKYVEMRIKGIELLLSEIYPEALMVIFPETDNAMHIKPNIVGKKYDPDYAKLLALIDEFIGSIINNFEIVLIISDHGIELYRKSINMAYVVNNLDSVYSTSLKELLFSTIASNYFVGLTLYSMLKHEISYKIFYRIRKGVIKALSKINDRNSSSGEKEELGKRGALLDLGDANDSWLIYLVDRGKVNSALELIREMLGEKLQTLEVIETTNKMYAILIEPKEGFYIEFGELHATNSKSVLWYPSTRHSPYGIFLLWQKGMDERKYIGMMENYDVLPTILALLEAPIPSYSDGFIINKRSKYFKLFNYKPVWEMARKIYWLHQIMGAHHNAV